MNTDYIIAVAGLTAFLVSMTLLWLFWIAVWAEFWRRRIGDKGRPKRSEWWRGRYFRCLYPWARSRSGFSGS